MPKHLWLISLAVAGVSLFICGCPPEDYPAVVPATLQQINPIVNSTTLSPQQKRIQLEGLGVVPETINMLLRNERTGNQYGGDLRTAYNKVVLPNFTLLTPDEVQIYGDGASQVDPNVSVTLTDDQGAAIVQLFGNNDLRSSTQLSAYLANPDNVLPPTIPNNVLGPLFVDFDPNLLLPILP